MLKLTDNEKAFLKQAINYGNAECQKEDNFSNAGVEEAAELMGGSYHRGKGLIGSLTAKGVGSMDGGEDIFWINDDMIDQVFTALELPLS